MVRRSVRLVVSLVFVGLSVGALVLCTGGDCSELTRFLIVFVVRSLFFDQGRDGRPHAENSRVVCKYARAYLILSLPSCAVCVYPCFACKAIRSVVVLACTPLFSSCEATMKRSDYCYIHICVEQDEV